MTTNRKMKKTRNKIQRVVGYTRVERQLADVEKKLTRWYEAFECGEVVEAVGKDRVAELKAARERVVETLTKVVPIKPVPPHIYKDETIWKFQAALRRLFASGDDGLARHYMRFLLDRIVVNGSKVEIQAKPTAAVALMAKAAGSSEGSLTPDDAVLTDVGGWLPMPHRNRTALCWVYRLASARIVSGP